MLEKTEEIIKNEQSRDIDKIKLARHGTNTNNTKTQHKILTTWTPSKKKMGVNQCAWLDTLCVTRNPCT